MKIRFAIVLALAVATAPALAQSNLMGLGQSALQSFGSAGGGGGSLGAGLSDGQIGSGLKEALRIGTEKAVSTVGRPGGFLDDAAVRIPLPGPLEKARSALAMVGASGLADDLETRINRAAEQAAPKAAGIFGDAVSRMSIADARGILTGPKDSATQYFKRTTTPQLTTAFRPIIDRSLANVGAVQSYNALASRARSMPFMSGVNLDLATYVLGKTLDGLFYYVARQEEAIRTDPAARTTDLLRTVFK
jgi:hypothetical protein